MKHFSSVLLLFSGILLSIASISSNKQLDIDASEANSICEPGETHECFCVNRQQGAQICNENGLMWDTCLCEVDDAGIIDTSAIDSPDSSYQDSGNPDSLYPNPICNNGIIERGEECETQTYCADNCEYFGNQLELNQTAGEATNLASYFTENGSFSIPLDSVHTSYWREYDDGGPSPVYYLYDEDYFFTDLLCPEGTLTARIEFDYTIAVLALSSFQWENMHSVEDPDPVNVVRSDNLFTDYQEITQELSQENPECSWPLFLHVRVKDIGQTGEIGNFYTLTGQITGCPETFPGQ